MINGPKRLSTLIESSWNQNIKERPEFPEIVDILYEISNNMQSTANIEVSINLYFMKMCLFVVYC